MVSDDQLKKIEQDEKGYAYSILAELVDGVGEGGKIEVISRVSETLISNLNLIAAYISRIEDSTEKDTLISRLTRVVEVLSRYVELVQTEIDDFHKNNEELFQESYPESIGFYSFLHSFKTSLSSLLMHFYLLQNLGETDISAYISEISEFINDVITDIKIINVSRIVLVDRAYFKKLEQNYRWMFRNYFEGIDFKCELECMDDVWIPSRLLAELITNLLDNAFKYTDTTSSEEGKLLVHLLLSVDATGVNITVTDEGIGVPLGEESKVFGRGQRALNAVKHANGTGRGLHYLQTELKSRGGWIRYTPREEKPGSIFTAFIPAVRDEEA